MKTALKIIAILLVLVFMGIQFVRPKKTNPPVNKNETLDAASNVPEQVSVVLKRSCRDCHSNETVYPWYSNVAPVSWSVVDHINEGRSELNFSKWGTYSDSKKRRKLKEICREVSDRNMPHNQYLWIHWDATLSDKDIELLCDWTLRERRKFVPKLPRE